ncbi:hypothetical protein AB5J62_15025 [Amycolatopsis sp. cg5]|uniref:hypothetical protein n=1 Tax=Amycolatopsis sp. cg5 TaxID=3238802 RepID=UPI0035269BBC
MNTKPTPFARRAVRAVVTFLLTLATVAGVLLTSAPAQAAPTASVKPTRISVPLVVKPGNGAANAVPEPCGTLFITIAPEGLGQQARLFYGFSITIGRRAVYRNLLVRYSNEANNVDKTFEDTGYMFSFVYDKERVVVTGIPLGTIIATIGASVVLTDFSECIGIASNTLPFP